MVRAKPGVIEKQLQARNWSIYRLADEARINPATIRSVLAGKEPAMPTAEAIWIAFGLGFSDLFESVADEAADDANAVLAGEIRGERG